MPGKLLSGKTALITGANRGIGRRIAEVFAEEGANLVAHARRETPDFVEDMRALAERCAVNIDTVYFDLSDASAVRSAAKALVTTHPKIDVLVNNAGIIHNAQYPMTTEDALRNVFEVNFFAQYLLTQYVVKRMQRNGGGSVINLSSVVAGDGAPGQSAYAASKAAIEAMTRSLAAEFGSVGIRVNAIAPGLVDTDMAATLPDNVVARAAEGCALGRLGTPDDVAGAAVWLASDLAGFVTGQIVRVDGGRR